MMKLETITTVIPTNEQLIKAISIRICRPFPALAICNALGGLETPEWKIIHEFSPEEMIQEAQERGIDVANIRCSLPDEQDNYALLKDTRYARFLK